MNLTNWYADHLGQHLDRRRVPAAVAPLRSVLMPPRPMPQETAALAAELLAERSRLTAADLLRDEFAAASVDFMLRTQDALHERQLAVAWNWVTLLAVMLGLTLVAFGALLFACAELH